jgi:hypothetical protein
MAATAFKRIPIVRFSRHNQRAESGDEEEGAGHRGKQSQGVGFQLRVFH